MELIIVWAWYHSIGLADNLSLAVLEKQFFFKGKNASKRMEWQRLDIWNDLLSHKNRFLFVRGDVSDLSLMNFTAMTKAGIVTCVKRGKSTLKLHIQRQEMDKHFGIVM